MSFVLNEFSQITNVEPKLTTYWHERVNRSGMSFPPMTPLLIVLVTGLIYLVDEMYANLCHLTAAISDMAIVSVFIL